MLKLGSNPDGPSTGEWTNKLWYFQTMKYYSALQRKELSSHEKIWKNLKYLLLNERSQSEMDIRHLEKANLWGQ